MTIDKIKESLYLGDVMLENYIALLGFIAIIISSSLVITIDSVTVKVFSGMVVVVFSGLFCLGLYETIELRLSDKYKSYLEIYKFNELAKKFNEETSLLDSEERKALYDSLMVRRKEVYEKWEKALASSKENKRKEKEKRSKEAGQEIRAELQKTSKVPDKVSKTDEYVRKLEKEGYKL